MLGTAQATVVWTWRRPRVDAPAALLLPTRTRLYRDRFAVFARWRQRRPPIQCPPERRPTRTRLGRPWDRSTVFARWRQCAPAHKRRPTLTRLRRRWAAGARYLDHPRRELDRLYRCAKSGWNRRSRFDSSLFAVVMFRAFGSELKTPISEAGAR